MSSLDRKTKAGISQLLPWYANGTLDTHERALVHDALEKDAGLREELRLIQEDSAATRELAAEDPTPTSMATRFKVQLDQELQLENRAPSDRGEAITKGAFARLTERFFPTRPVAYLAAIAACVIVLQSGAILSLLSSLPGNAPPQNAGKQLVGGSDTVALVDGIRPPQSSDSLVLSAIANTLKVEVQFNPNAGAGRIAEFLAANGGNIVAGPQPEGSFTLKFNLQTNAKKDEVVKQLASLENLFQDVTLSK